MTLADCEALVEQEILPLLGGSFTMADYRDPALAKNAVDLALQALIAHHRPWLNQEFNQDPRPLPEKYRKAKE